MDPLTHFITGVSIGTLSGTPLAWNNPIYTAVSLGSLAPDFDLFYRVQGEMSYLNKHRGMTHSFIGIVGTALIFSAFLYYFFFTRAGYLNLVAWFLIGEISHIALDLLNPHGVKLLWPFHLKRYNMNILNGFDPILILCLFSTILSRYLDLSYYPIGLILSGFYLFVRWKMAANTVLLIKSRLGEEIKKIIALPSMLSLWKWDFLADDGKVILVGEVKYFSRCLKVDQTLNKYEDKIIDKALNNNAGKIFCDFTQYMHISLKKKEDKIILEFTDLRYRIKQNFLHSAVLVYNQDEELEQATFHPFSKNRTISLM